MITIRELDHVVLRVVDLDRMLRSHCDVLGDPDGNVVELKGPPDRRA